MGLKVFVTGAKGFIGRHLMEVLDNATAYTGDILDRQQLTKEMRGHTAVVHLAAKFNIEDELSVYMTNVVGTANLVRAMQENKIKRVVYASSVGAGAKYFNAYDDSKHIAEKILSEKELDPIMLRFSNLYGKDQKDKLITNLLNGFEKGEVEVHGDGSQTRDFIYIDDAIRAIIAGLNAPRCKAPIDIGFGESKSVLDVINLISLLKDKKVKINFHPFNGGPNKNREMKVSFVDTTLANIMLGFNAKTSLEQGLSQII